MTRGTIREGQPFEESRLLREGDLIGPTAAAAKYRDLSNLGESLILAERVRELVPFTVRNGRHVLSGVPSASAVRTLAEEVVNMWPRGLDTAAIFNQRAAPGHNALYWGRRYPSGIRLAVARASLYADRIYVINPFIDSFVFHPQRSPLVEPGMWASAYAADAAFVSGLLPWIKAGIVELIPNPATVDFGLGNALANRAKDQLVALGPKHDALMDKHFIPASAESFLYMPDKDRDRVIENMGGASLADKRRLSEEVARLRALDPDVSDVISNAKTQMISTGPGASFPAVQLMTESLSASVISDDAMIMDRLRMAANTSTPSSQLLADAFQSLSFSFLNHVEVEAAVDIRQKRGMVSFRRYLQDIASLSAAAHATSSYELRVQACVERLADEYQAYVKEWEGLDKKLARDAFVATPALAGTAAVLTGKIDPVSIGSTCLTGLVKSLFDRWTNGRSHAARPLGVLMQVEGRLSAHRAHVARITCPART